jgi:5-methyltetrahydrofolate--homocysteine methyltransferase
MSAAAFLDALHSGRVLLMDGAMGTELQRAGIRSQESHELWNLTNPKVVHAIHQAYANAGAKVLLTNTFQAIHTALGPRGEMFAVPSHPREVFALTALQASACALARSASWANGFVLADIGSFVNKNTQEEFSDFSMLREAVRYLGPVDGLLLETCSTPRVQFAVGQVRRLAGDLPVLLSLTYRRHADGTIDTISGHMPEWFAQRAEKWGLAALGVNCGRDLGMDEVIEVVRRYRRHTALPLLARPNAGTPKQKGKQWVYPRTPADMAGRLPELLKAGATLVGGCCGTTPEHIAAFGKKIATDKHR